MDLENLKTLMNDPRTKNLDSFQQNVLWRLTVFSNGGPVSADPKSLTALLFPLKPDMRSTDVQRAVAALTLAGLTSQIVDDEGAPFVLVNIRPLHTAEPNQSDAVYGGDYRGGSSSGLRSLPNNLSQETVTKSTNSVSLTKQPYAIGLEHPTAEDLGLKTEDFEKYLEKREAIMKQASKSSLFINEEAIEKAIDLAEEYTLEWLLEAMKEAYDGGNWRYVKAILKRWKEQGHMGDSEEYLSKTSGKGKGKKSGKRVVTDEELRAWGIDP